MGFSFFCIEIPYYDFVIYDFVIGNKKPPPAPPKGGECKFASILQKTIR